MLDRLRTQFPPPATNPRGDNDLTPHLAMPDKNRVAAAVLVPIVDRVTPQVLLTRRSATLKKHAGQISFPGGRIDITDHTAQAAALREMKEEVAIDEKQVTLIGELDLYRTGTGFDITPFVGLLEPTIAPKGNPGEVEEIFEVPLDHLLDPANHVRETTFWRGQDREYYVIPYKDYRIWGATAGMLVNLAAVIETIS